MKPVIMPGNCVEVMAAFPEDYFDAIVTDPPYGLKFMNKGWDNVEYGFHREWADQAIRVLKPGGHMVSFGGTRTYHRMASAVEDAGFEIRDMIQWLYGQGFPKSMNVGKAIESTIKKGKSNTRSLRAIEQEGDGKSYVLRGRNNGIMGEERVYERKEFTPETDEAQEWKGWGTALKPAQEPIVLARKPFKGTVAKNVLEHGTGALNIDATRIDASGGRPKREVHTLRDDVEYQPNSLAGRVDGSLQSSKAVGVTTEGRWPANIILTHHPECEYVGTKTVGTGETKVTEFSQPDIRGNAYNDTKAKQTAQGVQYGAEEVPDYRCHPECPIYLLDAQSGELKSGSRKAGEYTTRAEDGVYMPWGRQPLPELPASTGGASRFFYHAKASKSERNAGMPEGVRNTHPTVKPIDLMVYLCRLITPPGGRILDPFVGSGTTGIAAAREGFEFYGIEVDEDYVEIARARLEHWAKVDV